MAESTPKGWKTLGGKGEIARYEQFLLFQQYFKTCTADTLKNKRTKKQHVWERVISHFGLKLCWPLANRLMSCPGICHACICPSIHALIFSNIFFETTLQVLIKLHRTEPAMVFITFLSHNLIPTKTLFATEKRSLKSSCQKP